MITETKGIILKETPYGETSKIIQVLTEEYGLISIMCKGAKSIKSDLRSSTLLFTYGTFNLYYKKDKLSNLISVDVINMFLKTRNDILNFGYVSYLADLTMQVLKQADYKYLYDDFLNALLKIEDGLDPLIISNIIELKYLPLLGVGVSLDGCAICGSTHNIITIDGDAGGYVCKKCYTNELLVDVKTIKLIRMYYLIDIKSISKLDISNKIKNEINTFIEKYYDRYTGLYLKSKEFLKSLKY